MTREAGSLHNTAARVGGQQNAAKKISVKIAAQRGMGKLCA
jgi:hypothetical protein